jgi:hypothetical protein
MDCFVAEFIIAPAEGGTRWLLAMTVFDPTPLAMTVSTSPGVSAIVQASSSAKADDPVFQSSCDEIGGRGVLDGPVKPDDDRCVEATKSLLSQGRL